MTALNRLEICVIAVCLAASASCASMGLPIGEAARPVGALSVSGAALGGADPVELTPTACRSGEHQFFLGADFVDESHGLIARLVVDPLGEATLRVFAAAEPVEPGVIFARSECTRFELELERTGWQLNEIYVLRVRLNVECGGEEGEGVSGSMSAEGCA